MLAVEGISKRFYDRSGVETEAIHELSLEVNKDEFVSVVGPSGCGKTTLLRLIAGLVEPSNGSISLQGREVKGPINDVGFVFQSPLLMQWRNAIENVLLTVELQHKPREQYVERAATLLDLFGLEGFHSKYPKELSGGMQQRVAIARALIHDPTILLMDEPLGSLDELTRDQMAVELLKIRESMNKTVVLVTHSITEAVFLADRVFVMSPRPSSLRASFSIDIERPRMNKTRAEPRFIDYCQQIRTVLGVG